MAHLDTEFKRQKNPELKSLIADQVGEEFLLYALQDQIVYSSKASKFTIPSVKRASGVQNGIRISLRLKSI